MPPPPCPPGSKGPECTKKKQIPSQNARALEQKTLDFAKQKTGATECQKSWKEPLRWANISSKIWNILEELGLDLQICK